MLSWTELNWFSKHAIFFKTSVLLMGHVLSTEDISKGMTEHQEAFDVLKHWS